MSEPRGLLKIQVNFPDRVEIPDGWLKQLDHLIRDLCEGYESQHPDMVMWPAGFGHAPNLNAPEGKEWSPEYSDPDVFTIDIAMRQNYRIVESLSTAKLKRDFDSWSEATEILSAIDQAFALGLREGKAEGLVDDIRKAIRGGAVNTASAAILIVLMEKFGIGENRELHFSPGEFASLKPGTFLKVKNQTDGTTTISLEYEQPGGKRQTI